MAKQRIATLGVLLVTGASGAAETVLDPYCDVDWDTVTCLHSFSHSMRRKAGCRRFAIWIRASASVQLLPSKPLYPLPRIFRRANPGVLGARDAEPARRIRRRTLTSSAVITTGYGESPSVQRDRSPIERPIFRGCMSSIRRTSRGSGSTASTCRSPLSQERRRASVRLTVDGARQVSYKDFLVGRWRHRARPGADPVFGAFADAESRGSDDACPDRL